MPKIDRQLKNRATPVKFNNKAKQSDYFVYYKGGRYFLIDLRLKKKGHSQKFK